MKPKPNSSTSPPKPGFWFLFFSISPFSFIRTTFPSIPSGNQLVIFGPSSPSLLTFYPSAKPQAPCILPKKNLPAPTAPHFPFMRGMAAYFPFLPGSPECQLLIPRAEGQSVPRTVAGQWLIPSLSSLHLLQFILDQEPGTYSADNSRTPCLC